MHLRQIDLNLFVIFDAIMTERSLSGAADRLGMSPSAVSHALNRLRELTGDDLFVRTGKGVRPTHRATQMAESVKRALDLVQTSLLHGHDFKFQAAEREFILDIPSGLETAFMPTFLTYPDLSDSERFSKKFGCPVAPKARICLPAGLGSAEFGV
jgi:DNA-binding transcriptional LysR family regulator